MADFGLIRGHQAKQKEGAWNPFSESKTPPFFLTNNP
jgi:hypothetical protein